MATVLVSVDEGRHCFQHIFRGTGQEKVSALDFQLSRRYCDQTLADSEKAADADNCKCRFILRRDDDVFDPPQVLFSIVLNVFPEDVLLGTPARDDRLQLDDGDTEGNLTGGRYRGCGRLSELPSLRNRVC